MGKYDIGVSHILPKLFFCVQNLTLKTCLCILVLQVEKPIPEPGPGGKSYLTILVELSIKQI